MAITNKNAPLGDLDPEMYKGKNIQVRGGPADGTNFFVAERPLIANEYDGILARPIRVNPEGDLIAHFFWTFKGRINETEELAASTVIIPLDMLMEIIRDARKIIAETPMHLRTMPGPKPGE